MRSPRTDNPATCRRALPPALLDVDVDGRRHTILLNADTGAWAEVDDAERTAYETGTLPAATTTALCALGVIADQSGRFVDQSAAWRNKPLERLIVNLTRACNLRCAYCFISSGPADLAPMDSDTMAAVVRAGVTSPGEHVTFDLHGGEPLIDLTSLRRFLDIAGEARTTIPKTIRCAIMTNANRVTDEFIDLARAHHLQVGVSLDGPPHINDVARTTADGHGTGARTLAAIRRLQDANVNVVGAICTIGQHNVERLADVAQLFGSLGLPFKARPITSQGRGHDSALALRPGQWAEAFQKLYRLHEDGVAVISTVTSYQRHCWTANRSNACLRIPCGAGNNLVAIDPDGSVYPCDGYCGIPSMKIGNINREPLPVMLNQDWVLQLRNRTPRAIAKCISCEFRGMCGPCGYSALGAHQTVNAPDPLCDDKREIFSFLIQEWLKGHSPLLPPGSSPGSKHYDYADTTVKRSALTRADTHTIGITQTSA